MTDIAATVTNMTNHRARFIMGGYPQGNPGARIVVIKLVGTTYTTGGMTLDLGKHQSVITANTAASPSSITIIDTAPGSTTPVVISGTNSSPKIDGSHVATYVSTHVLTVPVDVSGGTAGNCGEVRWGLFKDRIWWMMPMTYTAKNATTGYLQMGFVPGTAKTDIVAGGYATSGWKVQLSAGATETADNADISAYTFYAVVCGS
jgi:hypothetical protein